MKAKMKGILIAAVLLLALLLVGFTQPRHETNWAVLADSAATVADGSIGTAALTKTEIIDFVGPGARVFTDSLVLSSVWCAYHTWYEDSNSGDGIDTNFVACPVVGDTTNTAIFKTPYHSWLGIAFEPEGSVSNLKVRDHMNTWVCGIDSGSGFWIRSCNYDAANYDMMGDFWIVLRFGPP